MNAFEVRDRDGLARLGRLRTPHGIIETPALLPVVHPDPERQPIAPAQLRARFGYSAVITSSYIVWRTPALRSAAVERGLHGLLAFDGPVMTDSGAFQQHAYGAVEVGAEEIIAFQERIGSDVATVLDEFTEPESELASAEAALRTTIERAARARDARPGLLAVPVQGGSHEDLRARAAAEASRFGDVLAVGGVVPLLEQYRFAELARALAAARPSLAPGAAVHLFGTGHPMTFAFAALWGVDLLDSSAYHKFARRGALLFAEGTVPIDEVREAICRCALCGERPLVEVAGLPAAERERAIALHNLAMSAEEMARVRQAIREGSLWELAERRAASHPALRAGLVEAVRHPEVFLPTEPAARRSFREISPASRERPAVVRFRRRLEEFLRHRPLAEPIGRIALRPEYLGRVPVRDRSDRELAWQVATPLGPVPLELTEVYPVGPYLGVDEFLERPRHRPPTSVTDELAARRSLEADLDRDWTPEWTARQLLALLEWEYGREAADALAADASGERSRASGRLRAISSEGRVRFHVGTDGLARPTLFGGAALRECLDGDRGRVVVAEDAASFVAHGRSLFARFVVRADPELVPNASALLVDASDRLLGIGRLLLAPHEMRALDRGVAGRVTAHARRPMGTEDDEPSH
ncbi:MAG TPA: tRNA guanosine(15) transglycosylase TgtA [Thermoplasmata archaeon]|nr:tRNA guanosine(15) transglycosylase TgtA [Thermoplasmata archaeon]